MADGDITASVDADGCFLTVTIEGSPGGVDWGAKLGTVTYANQATRYIFGDVDSGAGNFRVDLDSQGYTNGILGTRARILFATSSVRKPYSDQLDIEESEANDDLSVKIALTECIYDDDTNVTITVAAGWATDSGDDSNLATTVAVTNNSTVDYPTVMGQWDWDRLRGGWRRMENDFSVGFRPDHGFGIDKVTLSAIGADSSFDTSLDVTSFSKTQNSNSLLYHESYQMPVVLASYDQGEQIDLRAIAYPLIGDADSILDTNTTTLAVERIRGLTTCFVMCDRTLALRKYATVSDLGTDAAQGSFANQTLSDATPHLTIGGALDDGANYILVIDDTDIVGSSVSPGKVEGFYVEVLPHPTASGTITLERAASNQAYATDFLCYTGDFDINYTSGNGWLDGSAQARQLLFDGVNFVSAGAPLVGLGYRSNGCYFLSCSGMGTDDYVSLSGNRVAYSFTGCSFDSNFKCDPWYTNIANLSTVVATIDWDSKALANAAPAQNNIFIQHNRIIGLTANSVANTWVELGENGNIQDVSFKGNNVVYRNLTTSSPVVWFCGDGSTTTCSNIIFTRNTFAGDRVNLFYNDDGEVALLRVNLFVRGNSFRSYNIKADLFAPANGNRIGNRAQIYGVNYRDNIYDGSASSNFIGEYSGLRTTFELAGDLVTFGELGYVDEQSIDLNSSGLGDYTPDTGSPLIVAAISNDFMGFDIFGNPNNNTEIGAIFILAVVLGNDFHEKLGNLGFTGAMPDRIHAYLVGEGFSGAFNDMAQAQLRALGYTGTYGDMLGQKASAESFGTVSEMWFKQGLIPA